MVGLKFQILNGALLRRQDTTNDLLRSSIVTRDTWHEYPKNTKSAMTITRDTQSYSSTAFLKIFLLQLKSQNRSVVMLEDGPPFPRSIRPWSEKF